MMFTIHKEKEPDRRIRIGYGVQPPPIENKQGRKQMAEEKKFEDVSGVKKVSEEPVRQGPVGTGGEQPPARPQNESDVKVGGKEERENA